MGIHAFTKEIVAIGAESAHAEHDRDVDGKDLVDYSVNVWLLKAITALVQNQLGVSSRIKYKQEHVSRVANMGSTGYELLQIEVDERQLLILMD